MRRSYWYVAVTSFEAQRGMRIFYELVKYAILETIQHPLYAYEI